MLSWKGKKKNTDWSFNTEYGNVSSRVSDARLKEKAWSAILNSVCRNEMNAVPSIWKRCPLFSLATVSATL